MPHLVSTPWTDLLRQALAAGIAPDAFWRLSLKEWRALAAPAPKVWLDRQALDGLMAAFPDGEIS